MNPDRVHETRVCCPSFGGQAGERGSPAAFARLLSSGRKLPCELKRPPLRTLRISSAAAGSAASASQALPLVVVGFRLVVVCVPLLQRVIPA